MTDGYLRIGEFSERVGVSPDLLRAWERRYGLLRPDRSNGGFRLYSDADLARVRRVLALADQGLSTAEAARLALEDVEVAAERAPPALEPAPPSPATSALPISPTEADDRPMDAITERLAAALEAYDEVTADQALDELFARFSPETVLREAILPELGRIGRRWASGELTVAQEHFASNLLRGRLLAMARGWGLAGGPMAVLATPPGEEHDLPLVTFGLALWRRGWRITFLGSDTPIGSLRDAVAAVRPAIVVLAAVDAARFTAVEAELAQLAGDVPLAIGGAGASAELADRLVAHHLAGDPVSAAGLVASVASEDRSAGPVTLRARMATLRSLDAHFDDAP